MYWASLGELSRAQPLVQTARDQFRSQAKLDSYLHASITAACIETGDERRNQFEALRNKVPTWQNQAHSIFIALANEALRDRTAEWRTLLQRIASKNDV